MATPRLGLGYGIAAFPPRPRRPPPHAPVLVLPKPKIKYGKKAWARDWGPFSDGRSRLSYLARRIVKELRLIYDDSSPAYLRNITSAARYLAIEHMNLESIGVLPKASRRHASGARKSAQMALTNVPLRPPPGVPRSGVDLASRMDDSTNSGT
jgi:hypothetical protein